MTFPSVSVIIPTTHDRLHYNERILNAFIRQDYKNKRIFFDYNPGNVGEKRNRICESSDGEIILHMDADDVYCDTWITYSVCALMESGADITGLSKLNFYDEANRMGWQYTYNDASLPWVAGATMCYWRKLWERCPFPNIQIGEDNLFVWGRNGVRPKVFAHSYVEGFCASIHPGNTSKKIVDNVRYRRCSGEEEMLIRKRFFAAELSAPM